ncbi:hypothetical protein CVS47_01415 [Microbacterium lemovicicum]|uniref:Uncharacterized protein n=2 Tax=Microbacterium lemovicicum TaxID=1072463 RepID=A0A3Q9IXY5_9MICO|nr:hypothetical protein CVS47_01415 [Microbacterium lemovicicum]
MPSQMVRIPVAQPPERIDHDAARLAAAKIVTPAAVNSHGVEFLGATATATGTVLDFRVWT